VKVKTALKQSKAHAKFLIVILVLLIGLLALLREWSGLICVGLVALGLAMEVINIVYITRNARANPDYLEERID
jgi:hypothetical protein